MPETTIPDYRKPFSVLISLFFMWGFITCLNDSLIPHFKEVFTLTYFESALVQFAFFIAYFIGSLIYFLISASSGDPINKIGYKNGIILGLAIAGLGCALFYPAAQFVSFPFFLAALFVLALGFTLLQIAANPYVLILGDPSTASNRLNLAGGFNSFGTTIAPIIGGTLILGGVAGAAKAGIDTVKIPYLVFALAFVALIIVFKFTNLPRFKNMESIEKGMGALKYPQLVMGVIAIVCYVGAEVTVGSFLTSFAGLPDIAGMSTQQATGMVALYWGSLMIGRFTGSLQVFNISTTAKRVLTILVPFIVFGFVSAVLSWKGIEIKEPYYYVVFILISIAAFFLAQSKPAKTMMYFPVFCIALLGVAIFAKEHLALWALVSLGLYNSVMWPCIFDLSIKGLGKHTSQGSSLLVMGILGGAIVPLIQGMFADSSLGLHASFFVPVVCYIYLAFFGYRVKGILKAQNVYDENAISSGH